MQGITGSKHNLDKICIKPKIILGSKIINIRQVYAYEELDVDLLLENNFVQQF